MKNKENMTDEELLSNMLNQKTIDINLGEISILSMTENKEKKKPSLKKYEIWIGYVPAWGQGDHASVKPQKIGEVEATSFKIACCIYEHQNHIDTLKMRMELGDTYIEDAWFGHWGYNPKDNSTMYLGKYFETEEDALQTFKK